MALYPQEASQPDDCYYAIDHLLNPQGVQHSQLSHVKKKDHGLVVMPKSIHDDRDPRQQPGAC